MKKFSSLMFVVIMFFSAGCEISQTSDKTDEIYDQGDAPNISTFILAESSGIISDNKISVTVPYGTNIKNLIAYYATNADEVLVNNKKQISGITINDFSKPIIYNVSMFDGTSKQYTVTVDIGRPLPRIISFSILNCYGSISDDGKITVTVPYGTNRNNLIANFTSNTDQVLVNGLKQVSGVTTNNFTYEVIYIAKNNDGTSKQYSVIVEVGKSSSKDITEFFLSGYKGSIVGTAISVTVPYGTNIKQMVATFKNTGVNVFVNGYRQYSGVTKNDFSNSVKYTVKAQDGSTKNYFVTVTTSPSTSKDFIRFTIDGKNGIISNDTINLSISCWNDITSLVSSFTTNGKSVMINDKIQTSGVTVNDFSQPVIYTVMADDGSKKNYTVDVTYANNCATLWITNHCSYLTITKIKFRGVTIRCKINQMERKKFTVEPGEGWLYIGSDYSGEESYYRLTPGTVRNIFFNP